MFKKYKIKLFQLLLCLIVGIISEVKAEEHHEETAKKFSDNKLIKIIKKEKQFFKDVESNAGSYDEEEVEHQAELIAKDYERFVIDNEESTEGYILFGKFLRRIGYNEEANSMFVKADKLDPTIGIVKQQIGNYLAEKGDYGLALHYYLSAVELEPEVTMYHYGLGELLYYYKSDYIKDEILTENEFDRQMLRAFGKAVCLDPKERVLQFRLAEAYYDLNHPDWRESLRLWRELEKTSTDAIDRQIVYLHQARVLLELGRTQDSQSILNKVQAPELREGRRQVEEMLPKDF